MLVILLHTRCVIITNRLIMYRIIYLIIRLNEHRLFQNNILLMQHIWLSEFSTPRSRIGIQLLLGPYLMYIVFVYRYNYYILGNQTGMAR
jgi:hypothetical protein